MTYLLSPDADDEELATAVGILAGSWGKALETEILELVRESAGVSVELADRVLMALLKTADTVSERTTRRLAVEHRVWRIMQEHGNGHAPPGWEQSIWLAETRECEPYSRN